MLASSWEQSLNAHRSHRTFRTRSWVLERELGFSCACCGDEDEYRIGLSALRGLLPETHESFARLRRHSETAGSKEAKREWRRANQKAKALLHQHLTKIQRQELRAMKAFDVTGRDGKVYRITEGTTSNVQLLEGGVAVRRFCVVAKGLELPVYDLMLAQKLLLESNPEAFHGLAVVHDIRAAG